MIINICTYMFMIHECTCYRHVILCHVSYKAGSIKHKCVFICTKYNVVSFTSSFCLTALSIRMHNIGQKAKHPFHCHSIEKQFFLIQKLVLLINSPYIVLNMDILLLILQLQLQTKVSLLYLYTTKYFNLQLQF